MSEEIEIEFKNLILKKEYEKLINHYQLKPNDGWLQINHYFDTPDFHLKKHQAMLRIRLFKDNAEMTLKTPYGEHLLETNIPLSKNKAKKLLDSLEVSFEIEEKLNQLNVDPDDLQYQTYMSTFRYEINNNDHLIVIDKSEFEYQTDYELEIEAESSIIGQKVMNQVLSLFNIPKRKTPNKIERAYHYLTQTK